MNEEPKGQDRSGPWRALTASARRVAQALYDLLSRVREPELRIDMKRVNFELRNAALASLAEDVLYRDRVKQRIREGASCTYPPLIDRGKVLQFRRPCGHASGAGNA